MKGIKVPTAVVLVVFSWVIALCSVAQLAVFWALSRPALPALIPPALLMASGLLLAVLLRACAVALGFLAGVSWNVQAIKLHSESLLSVRNDLAGMAGYAEDAKAQAQQLCEHAAGINRSGEALHGLSERVAGIEQRITELCVAGQRSAAALEAGLAAEEKLSRIEASLKELNGFFGRIEKHLDLQKK